MEETKPTKSLRVKRRGKKEDEAGGAENGMQDVHRWQTQTQVTLQMI